MVKSMKQEERVEVKLCCQTLEVSRSGYYSWLKRSSSVREEENAVLLTRIRSLHEESKQTYGSPRMTAKLKSEGYECSKNRVARIMRDNSIASEAVKKFKITTTDSKHDLPIAERIFKTEDADSVMGPNQVWTGDITYIPTLEGWLFLAVFLDIFTRKIVGFSCDDNMETELILNALAMALGRQDVGDGELINHSDRPLGSVENLGTRTYGCR
jgi:putative transposase